MLLPLLTTLIVAGCGGPDDALTLSDPVQLERSRTVARPGLGEESPWLGRTLDFTYDPATRRLLGINADERFAFEMDMDGRLVRRYGRPGQGPGELENPLELVPAADTLTILDIGNMKLARFPRAGGPPREIRISTYYRDLVATERGVLAVPGPDSFALGHPGGGAGAEGDFGSRAELPAQCRNFCLLTLYDRTDVGNDIAVDWPRVFTVSVRDGSILEYRIPESYRSMQD